MRGRHKLEPEQEHNKVRHYCTKCKRKRYEKDMEKDPFGLGNNKGADSWKCKECPEDRQAREEKEWNDRMEAWRNKHKSI